MWATNFNNFAQNLIKTVDIFIIPLVGLVIMVMGISHIMKITTSDQTNNKNITREMRKALGVTKVTILPGVIMLLFGFILGISSMIKYI